MTVGKLIGVNIDQNISWKPHTDKVHRTISMILARFRRRKPFLPTHARIKFCQAFVFPHLDYCSCIWGSVQLGRLFKLHNRGTRIIYDLPTRTPIKPLLKNLGWLSLTDRDQYSKSLMVYKSLKGLTIIHGRNLFMMLVAGSHDIQTKLSCIWPLYF